MTATHRTTDRSHRHLPMTIHSAFAVADHQVGMFQSTRRRAAVPTPQCVPPQPLKPTRSALSRHSLRRPPARSSASLPPPPLARLLCPPTPLSHSLVRPSPLLLLVSPSLHQLLPVPGPDPARAPLWCLGGVRARHRPQTPVLIEGRVWTRDPRGSPHLGPRLHCSVSSRSGSR
jgi:hypothetical protein